MEVGWPESLAMSATTEHALHEVELESL